MICILSQSFRELGTESVMLWLEHWGVPHCRLNADDLMSDHNGSALTLGANGYEFEWTTPDGLCHNSRDIKVAWFRRWDQRDYVDLDLPDIFGEERWRVHNTGALKSHLQHEFRAVSGGVFAAFAHVAWLNPPTKCGLNKLVVLAEARRCGLDTPATVVTADLRRILEFGLAHREVISKCAGDVTVFMANDQIRMPATTRVQLDTLSQDWSGGFPTLVQERIERDYELRIFVIDGVCTTFAYIYWLGAPNVIDGRRGEMRTVPYKLPEHIECAIGQLMQKLELQIGCVDMVKTRDGRWVFLEVNPNGQYWLDGMMCNGKLDKQIALALRRRMEAIHVTQQ